MFPWTARRRPCRRWTVGEIHPPVHREHLRRQLRVRVHEVGRILQEEDPFHSGRSDRLQQGC